MEAVLEYALCLYWRTRANSMFCDGLMCCTLWFGEWVFVRVSGRVRVVHDVVECCLFLGCLSARVEEQMEKLLSFYFIQGTVWAIVEHLVLVEKEEAGRQTCFGSIQLAPIHDSRACRCFSRCVILHSGRLCV